MVDASQVSEKMASLKNQIESVTNAFSQTTNNLMTKMTEMSNTLKSITAASEILPKIKMQNAENNRFMQKLEQSLSGLMRRLDKLMV